MIRLRSNATMFKDHNGEERHLDPDAAVFGTYKKPFSFGLMKGDCIRYYYTDGAVKPIRFHELNPHYLEGNGDSPVDTDNLLVTPGELAQIFNPRFYKIISDMGKNLKQDFALYAALAAAFFSAYNAWKIGEIASLLGL